MEKITMYIHIKASMDVVISIFYGKNKFLPLYGSFNYVVRSIEH